MQPHNPLPEGWPRPQRPFRLTLAVGYLGLFALGMVAGAVWAVISDQIGAGILLLLGAIGFGHLAGSAASQLRRPHGRGRATTGTTDNGETGLAYPYAWGPYYWLLAALGLVALALLGVVALALLGDGLTGWLVALAAAALTAYVIWFLLVVLRLAPGRVVLTPTGIYHRSLTFEHFVPWFAVTDVVADQEDHPVIAVKARPAEGSRGKRYGGRVNTYETQFLPYLVVRSYRLGANTVPAFRALSYYFHHPSERAQLAAAPRTFIDS